MGLLNKTMLGTDEIYGSVILDRDDPSVTKDGGSAYSNGTESGTYGHFHPSRLDCCAFP